MNLLFVWTGVTSYMADCWRELARRPGVFLRVVVVRQVSGREFAAEEVLHGLDWALVDDGDVSALPSEPPDVLFAVGWHARTVRRAVARYPQVRKFCCFDMPWRWMPRCLAARFVLGRYARAFDGAFVPGAAAARYARWIGFRSVQTGLFSIDQARFAPAASGGRRTGFLYIGRDSSEKRLDLLRAAYRRYRAQGGAWPLDLYGNFDLARASSEPEGIRRHAFVQPAEVPALYHAHACLVLASAFDPWPLVMLEARSAGCAVIASDRCGNRVEVGAHAVPYGDVSALAEAMRAAERGTLSQPRGDLARYTCAAWADRVWALATP